MLALPLELLKHASHNSHSHYRISGTPALFVCNHQSISAIPSLFTLLTHYARHNHSEKSSDGLHATNCVAQGTRCGMQDCRLIITWHLDVQEWQCQP